jgi:hypothetical protein
MVCVTGPCSAAQLPHGGQGRTAQTDNTAQNSMPIAVHVGDANRWVDRHSQNETATRNKGRTPTLSQRCRGIECSSCTFSCSSPCALHVQHGQHIRHTQQFPSAPDHSATMISCVSFAACWLLCQPSQRCAAR